MGSWALVRLSSTISMAFPMGFEDDSWKTVLTKAGVEVVPVPKGTAEFDGFVDIWVDHIQGPPGIF